MSATTMLLGLMAAIFLVLLVLVGWLLPATRTEVVPRHAGDPDWKHSPASRVLALVIFLVRLVFWNVPVLWGLAMLSLVFGSKTHEAGIIEGAAQNLILGVLALQQLSFGALWYAVTPGFYFLLAFFVLALLGTLVDDNETQDPGARGGVDSAPGVDMDDTPGMGASPRDTSPLEDDRGSRLTDDAGVYAASGNTTINPMQETVTYARRLETILVRQFRANGRGLHEKLTSVEHLIPGALRKRIRYIATRRNKLLHEDGYEIKDSTEFLETARRTVAELEDLAVRLHSRHTETAASAPSDISVADGSILWKFVGYGGVLLAAWMLLPSSEHPNLDRLMASLKESIFAFENGPHSGTETPQRALDDLERDQAVSQPKPEHHTETQVEGPGAGAGVSALKSLANRDAHENVSQAHTPPAPAHIAPAIASDYASTFSAGDHVGLGSEELSIEDIQFAFKRGSFNDMDPRIAIRVRNNSDRTLSSARLQVRLYIPGSDFPVIASPSKGKHVDIYFGERGLAPGHVLAKEVRVSGFDAYAWRMPDILRARAYQLVARVIEVKDGSYSRFGSPAHDFDVLGTRSGVASMRVQVPAPVLPAYQPDELLAKVRRDFTDGRHVALGNEVLEIESVSFRYVTGSFGRSEPRIDLGVRNISTRTISSARLQARLFIDQHSRPVVSTGGGNGVFDGSLLILFGEYGLPAGQKTTASIRVSGHDAYAWTTPDILNARHRQLLLRLVEVQDGLNNRIGEQALQFSALTPR